jgi:hypothetical protein
MQSVFLGKVGGVAVAVLLLSACAGSGSSVPAGGVAPQAPGWLGNGDAAPLNLSGQYKGSLSTSQLPHVKAALDVGQYGAAIGGKLKLYVGTPSITDDAVWTVSGSKLAGTIVATADPCVFATTAAYDPTTHVLSGKFSPVHGCSATASGKYILKHQCIYKPGRTQDVRPDAGGLKMC